MHAPVHYAHKQATVSYNEVSYSGRFINRGSVCVSAPFPSSVKSPHVGAQGTMDGLIGGHITLDHMYERMQEHDPARTNVVWPLWIVS